MTTLRVMDLGNQAVVREVRSIHPRDIGTLDLAKFGGRLARPQADIDTDLDTHWCDSGIVRITPLLREFQVLADVEDGPYLASPAPTDMVVGTDGRLYYPDQSGVAFAEIIDLGSDKIAPAIPPGRATHRVDFIDIECEGEPVTFDSRPIRLDSSLAFNDLALLSPLPTGGGESLARGPGIVDAEIVNGNELLLTFADGGTANAGEVPTPALVTWDGTSYDDRPHPEPVMFVGPANPDTLGLMLVGDAWLNTDPDSMPEPDLIYLLATDVDAKVADEVADIASLISAGLADASGDLSHPLGAAVAQAARRGSDVKLAATTILGTQVDPDRVLWTSATIPATDLRVGMVIQVVLPVSLAGIAGSGTFSLDHRVNGITVVSSRLVSVSQTGAFSTASVGGKVKHVASIWVEALGVGGVVSVDVDGVTRSDAVGTTIVEDARVVSQAADLSAGLTYSVVANMSVADPGNTITLQRAVRTVVA